MIYNEYKIQIYKVLWNWWNSKYYFASFFRQRGFLQSICCTTWTNKKGIICIHTFSHKPCCYYLISYDVISYDVPFVKNHFDRVFSTYRLVWIILLMFVYCAHVARAKSSMIRKTLKYMNLNKSENNGLIIITLESKYKKYIEIEI